MQLVGGPSVAFKCCSGCAWMNQVCTGFDTGLRILGRCVCRRYTTVSGGRANTAGKMYILIDGGAAQEGEGGDEPTAEFDGTPA